MPCAKPAELCQHTLPSGQTCRQVALKDEQLCRHHRRLFNKSETEMINDEALDRLAAKLHSLDLPQLLSALYGKLTRLRSTVRAVPEAQLAVQITLERLKATQTNRQPTPMNSPETPMKSMNYTAAELMKLVQNQ